MISSSSSSGRFLPSWSRLVTLLPLMMTSTTVANNFDNGNSNNNNDDDCPLWLAESHTSTKAKIAYGLFAGRLYKENEEFLEFAELAIPLIDFVNEYNRDTTLNDLVVEFVENHLWTGEYAGSLWEANTTSPLAIPGVGVLSNYHTCTSNVDFTQASVLLRRQESFFPRKEPGKRHLTRGAITPYYNVTIHATRDIPQTYKLY